MKKIKYIIVLILIKASTLHSAEGVWKEIEKTIGVTPYVSELDNEVKIEKYGKKFYPPEADWGGGRARISGSVQCFAKVSQDGNVEKVVPLDYTLYIFIDEAVATLMDTKLTVGLLDNKPTKYWIQLLVFFDLADANNPHIRQAYNKSVELTSEAPPHP